MAEFNFAFMSFLGIEVVEFGGGKSVLEMKIEKQHLQSMGWTHGGIYAALSDGGMYCAVAEPGQQRFVTVSLTVNMMAASKLGDVLTCTSEALHRGRSTAVARGVITDPSGRQLAASQATFLATKE